MSADKLLQAAEELGATDGRAAAIKIAPPALPPPLARRILEGYADKNEKVMDIEPKPLSGEWADEPTAMTVLGEIVDKAGGQLLSLRNVEIDEDTSLFDTYQEAFSEAFWNTLLPKCRLILEQAEDDAE